MPRRRRGRPSPRRGPAAARGDRPADRGHAGRERSRPRPGRRSRIVDGGDGQGCLGGRRHGGTAVGEPSAPAATGRSHRLGPDPCRRSSVLGGAGARARRVVDARARGGVRTHDERDRSGDRRAVGGAVIGDAVGDRRVASPGSAARLRAERQRCGRADADRADPAPRIGVGRGVVGARVLLHQRRSGPRPARVGPLDPAGVAGGRRLDPRRADRPGPARQHLERPLGGDRPVERECRPRAGLAFRRDRPAARAGVRCDRRRTRRARPVHHRPGEHAPGVRRAAPHRDRVGDQREPRRLPSAVSQRRGVRAGDGPRRHRRSRIRGRPWRRS